MDARSSLTGRRIATDRASCGPHARSRAPTANREGFARAIGVCNFDAPLLEQLLAHASAPVALVQNWMDPFHPDAAARAVARAAGVAYQSFSTMGRQYIARYVDGELTNVGENPVLADATLGAIARKHGRAPAAVALRWAVQLGAAVLPQSSREDHLHDNLRVLDAGFELDADDMAAIAALEGKVQKS
jgi:2,5-diketo-D-gluconate reductase A